MLAVFIVVVVVAGFIWWAVRYVRSFYAMQNTAFQQLAVPLATSIGGTADPKKKSIAGSYQGLPAAAQVSSTGTDANDRPTYGFIVTMTAGTGANDWTIEYGAQGLLGSGPKAWHVKAHDKELIERLTAAGALDAVARWTWGMPSIRYSAKQGTLVSQTPVQNIAGWPDEAALRSQLDVLAALAAANRQANGAVGVAAEKA